MAKRERRSALEQERSSAALRSMLDSAEEALSEAEAGPGAGKGKPGHSGQKGTDSAGRSKATYGISVEAQKIARELAEAEEISQGDVVEVALRALQQLHQAGRVDLHPFKVPARSLKAIWKLGGLDEFQLFPE